MIEALRKLWEFATLRKDAPKAGTSTRTEVEQIAAHIGLGRRGEDWAVAYLERAGYRIVGANFELPIGRNARGVVIKAEIDIVAYDGSMLCFIEVKTRASDWFAPPQVNVDAHKQRQVARAARVYRRMLDLMDAPYRYDVLSLILPASDTEAAAVVSSATLLKNFWSDSKFRKRRWSDASYD
ncbi:MAG: YraN family protein [Pyrinomonadaceae bacterium]